MNLEQHEAEFSHTSEAKKWGANVLGLLPELNDVKMRRDGCSHDKQDKNSARSLAV
jgi:hypothetical protein